MTVRPLPDRKENSLLQIREPKLISKHIYIHIKREKWAERVVRASKFLFIPQETTKNRVRRIKRYLTRDIVYRIKLQYDPPYFIDESVRYIL